MHISPKTSLAICIIGTLLSIGALVAGKWIAGIAGLVISAGLWGIHYKSFMVD